MAKYKATKSFNHDQLGHVAAGEEFEATDAQAWPVLSFVELLGKKASKTDADEEADAGKKAKGK